MLATGKTVSQIAVDMNLSVKTISTYRGRVLDKMGMRTNAELTYYAVREPARGVARPRIRKFPQSVHAPERLRTIPSIAIVGAVAFPGTLRTRRGPAE